MEPRACACCGEPFFPKAIFLSRHPGFCPSCSSLIDGMESNQNERSKPWNGMPQTPTSVVTGHKPQIWGNRMSNRARGKQTSNAANAQATHTAEVILVALA